MSNISASSRASSRIAWVDVAKGLGIALVFYGHLVERFRDLEVPAALEQMKWVYSFHMPMFFLLVGIVYKDRGLSLDRFIRRQVLTRLVPVWAFNLVGMFIWIATNYAQGDTSWVGAQGFLPLVKHCGLQILYAVLQGLPTWNVLTWFIICLFVVEFWQFLLRNWTRNRVALAVSVVVFGALTALVYYLREAFADTYGDRVHWWCISSAVGAMTFYQLGILLRRLGLLEGTWKVRPYFLGALFLVISVLVFDRNHVLAQGIVLMAWAEYGVVGWFFLGVLAGTFFIICLSQILAGSRLLNYVGKITLGLMLLDGILHESVNAWLAGLIVRWGVFPENGSSAPYILTGVCVAVTVLSIAVCIPIAWLLTRYVPFMLGRGWSRPAATERPAKPS